MFQFHNGTINTELFFDIVILIVRFNSTTVQLIRLDGENGINQITGFNSTTVQLIRIVIFENVVVCDDVSIPQRYN